MGRKGIIGIGMIRIAGHRRAGAVEAQLALARQVVDMRHAGLAHQGELVGAEGRAEQLGGGHLHLGGIKTFVTGDIDRVAAVPET